MGQIKHRCGSQGGGPINTGGGEGCMTSIGNSEGVDAVFQTSQSQLSLTCRQKTRCLNTHCPKICLPKIHTKTSFPKTSHIAILPLQLHPG